MSNKKEPAQAQKASRPKRSKALVQVDQPDVSDGGELSAQEAAFVDHFVSGQGTAGDATAAAKAAGYAESSARTSAYRLMQRLSVRNAIDAALREAIGTNLTVEAVAVIRRIIRDETAPLKLRGDMAAKVVEFSGLVERVKQKKAEDTGLGGKKLAEMSRDELRNVIAQGAAVLAHAAVDARTIEGTARDSAQDSAQVEDAIIE